MKGDHDTLLVGRCSDGNRVLRPISPHLQVYRWPVSMVLSITHRMTGIALAIGALMMAWWLLAAAISDAAFATVQGLFGSGLGIVLLMGWVAALLFHLLLGIRHLLWDAGWGFGPLTQQQPVGLKTQSRIYRISGWFVIGLAVVATLVIWVTGLVMWR